MRKKILTFRLMGCNFGKSWRILDKFSFYDDDFIWNHRIRCYFQVNNEDYFIEVWTSAYDNKIMRFDDLVKLNLKDRQKDLYNYNNFTIDYFHNKKILKDYTVKNLLDLINNLLNTDFNIIKFI